MVEFANIQTASSRLLRRVQLRELGALVLAGARLISLPSLTVAHLVVYVKIRKKVGPMVIIVDRGVVIRDTLVVFLVVWDLTKSWLLRVLTHQALRVGIIDISYRHLLVLLYRTRARRQARLDHVQEREVLRKLIQTFCLSRRTALWALYRELPDGLAVVRLTLVVVLDGLLFQAVQAQAVAASDQDVRLADLCLITLGAPRAFHF